MGKNYSIKVKCLKRYCPNCHTQELVGTSSSILDSVVCTWCDCEFVFDQLVSLSEIRDKKIVDILI